MAGAIGRQAVNVLFTVKEAAAYLGVTQAEVKRLVREGELPVVSLPGVRGLRVPADNVKALEERLHPETIHPLSTGLEKLLLVEERESPRAFKIAREMGWGVTTEQKEEDARNT